MALSQDDVTGIYTQFLADIHCASLQMIPASSISTWQMRIKATNVLIQEVWHPLNMYMFQLSFLQNRQLFRVGELQTMLDHLTQYSDQLTYVSDLTPSLSTTLTSPESQYTLDNLRRAYHELAQRVYMALRIHLGDQHRLHSQRDEILLYSTSASEVCVYCDHR